MSELTIDQVLTAGLAVVPSEARARIQRDADRLGLGVVIDEVQLLDSKPPVGVRRAFTDVQDALADRERSITQAEFAADRLEVATRTQVRRMLQEARSEAEALTAEAAGRASAFKDLAAAVVAADEPSLPFVGSFGGTAGGSPRLAVVPRSSMYLNASRGAR